MLVHIFPEKRKALMLSCNFKIAQLLFLRVFLLVALLLTSGCSPYEPRYDYEKQKEFEALFSLGMSQDEVEQILDGLGDYELKKMETSENGNIHITYITQSENWGAPVYFFHFSPNGGLSGLNPPEPL